jgi:hypothetical protein
MNSARPRGDPTCNHPHDAEPSDTGRTVSRVAPLIGATRADLPPCCVDCVFWQNTRAVEDGRGKDRWSHMVERDFGAWGRMLFDKDEFRGMIQYGPAEAFARSRAVPSGPPSADAALLTCVFLDGDDLPGACERLVLEALADLKARDLAAVEAFAVHYPDEVSIHDRFAGHHTLFDRTFLARFGFEPVRSVGQVSLMRLPLGGLERPAFGVLARVLARFGGAQPAVSPGAA